MENIRLLFQYKNKFHHLEEIEMRGYLNAVVEINGNKYYKVVFYTFEEVEFIKKNGGNYFAEPGMIIISELTKERMLASVKGLYESSIFFHESRQWPAEKFKDYKEADF